MINENPDSEIDFGSNAEVIRWSKYRSGYYILHRILGGKKDYKKKLLERDAFWLAGILRKMAVDTNGIVLVPSADLILPILVRALGQVYPTFFPRTHIRFLVDPNRRPELRSHHKIMARLSAENPSIRIYAETAELTNQLEQQFGYTGVREFLLPLACKVPKVVADKPDHRGCFNIGFLGGKRPEQGADRIAEIVRHLADLRRKNSFSKLNILIQAPGDTWNKSKLQIQKEQALRGYFDGFSNDDVSLEWLPSVMSEKEFVNAIQRSDVLALPYDVGSYGTRGSGIVIDGTMSGTPLVVSKGFAMKRWQDLAETLQATTDEEFARCILEICRDYGRFRERARKAAQVMSAAMEERLTQVLS